MNELNAKRWKKFRSQKLAVFSSAVLLILGLLSVSAEWVSNSKPILIKHQGHLYFPVLKQIHPSVFGVTDRLIVDYRSLPQSDGDWMIWPVNPWDPFESNTKVEKYPSPPSKENHLGTDDRGRDIFARLLYGYRYSMAYALVVWVLTVVIAVWLGGLMGFFGGRVDMIGQRIVEVLSTVPTLFLLIILVSIFDPSLFLLICFTCLFSWISLSYFVRAEFLKNRKRDFVEAARSIGARNGRLIFIHILPNSLVPVITFSPFIIASNILGLASLDYLGFGLKQPTPSWGELLNQAQKNFTTAWWLALFPGLALFLTLVFLGLVGEGVRNVYDPNKG